MTRKRTFPLTSVTHTVCDEIVTGDALYTLTRAADHNTQSVSPSLRALYGLCIKSDLVVYGYLILVHININPKNKSCSWIRPGPARPAAQPARPASSSRRCRRYGARYPSPTPAATSAPRHRHHESRAGPRVRWRPSRRSGLRRKTRRMGRSPSASRLCAGGVALSGQACRGARGARQGPKGCGAGEPAPPPEARLGGPASAGPVHAPPSPRHAPDASRGQAAGAGPVQQGLGRGGVWVGPVYRFKLD